MSLDEVERTVHLKDDQIFAHSNFIRAEIERLKDSFERNERFKEFDGLIRTNHKIYEAVEANFTQEKLHHMKELTKQTNRLAEWLEQIGKPQFTKDELDGMHLHGKPMSEIARLAESKQREIEERRGKGEEAAGRILPSLEEE